MGVLGFGVLEDRIDHNQLEQKRYRQERLRRAQKRKTRCLVVALYLKTQPLAKLPTNCQTPTTVWPPFPQRRQGCRRRWQHRPKSGTSRLQQAAPPKRSLLKPNDLRVWVWVLRVDRCLLPRAQKIRDDHRQQKHNTPIILDFRHHGLNKATTAVKLKCNTAIKFSSPKQKTKTKKSFRPPRTPSSITFSKMLN